MAQLVLVVLTALAAVAGYIEAARLAPEHGKGLMGVPPLGWAFACGVAGLIGAIVVPAFVVGVLAGVVGYNEARTLQEQWREAPFGVAVPVWVVICAVFGFGGAVLTSPAVWLVVCGFLALTGALLLVIESRKILADEKRVLLAENRRLHAEKSQRQPIDRARVAPNPAAAQTDVTGSSGTPQLPDPRTSGWPGSALQRSLADPAQSAETRQRRPRDARRQ